MINFIGTMKILILLETLNGIRSLMVDELLKMHHEVTVYPNEIPKYRYTFFDKINNLLSLDKKRISRKRENHLREESSREINQIISKNYDLIIVFRPDSYEKNFLIKLKNQTKRMVAYQWDGIERYPKVKEYIPIFDEFYCFNPPDCGDEIKFLPNFYFENLVKYPLPDKNGDFIYIGYYDELRQKALSKMSKELKDTSLSYKFELKSFDKKNKEKLITDNPEIKFIDEIYDYETLFDIHKNYKVFIDIKQPIHEGLSFRFFEALVLQSKIITNNVSIKTYNFYHPNNILVVDWEKITKKEILDFFAIPYYPINPKIVEEYSFKNWINKIEKKDITG